MVNEKIEEGALTDKSSRGKLLLLIKHLRLISAPLLTKPLLSLEFSVVDIFGWLVLFFCCCFLFFVSFLIIFPGTPRLKIERLPNISEICFLSFY